MTEVDWKLMAVGRDIDLAICEVALREIDDFRPMEGAGDPYMQIAGFAKRRTREALETLASSRRTTAITREAQQPSCGRRGGNCQCTSVEECVFPSNSHDASRGGKQS